MERPNPRVQRTRSSPSALHAPLTRHPLGGRMGQVSALASVAVALARLLPCFEPVRTSYAWQGMMFPWQTDVLPFRQLRTTVAGLLWRLVLRQGNSHHCTSRTNCGC